MDTEYPIFVVYNNNSEKVHQKLVRKLFIDQYGLSAGTEITNIIIYTGMVAAPVLTNQILLQSNNPDVIKLKPTDELKRYLLCRVFQSSQAANVWYILRESAINREQVQKNVAAMQYVYFTDELDMGRVERKQRRYISISQLETYLIEHTDRLQERLCTLQFYVKIDGFYFATVRCGLAKSYKDTLLQIAQNKRGTRLSYFWINLQLALCYKRILKVRKVVLNYDKY